MNKAEVSVMGLHDVNPCVLYAGFQKAVVYVDKDCQRMSVISQWT